MVAGAAAKIAGNCLFYLMLIWLRILVQQSLGRQQHPGSAKATLNGTMLHESLLERV